MTNEHDSAVDEAPDLAAFRTRVRAWLAETAPANGWIKEPGAARRRVGLGDHEAVERNRACQRALFDAGFAGLSWPEEYGGQGLALREQIVFNEEATSYHLPLGIYIIGLGMCGPTILAVGSEAQKQRYIPPMVRGEEVWCQLFSEPSAGSDVASLSTKAVRDGGDWVLNGQKVWTSGAHHSELGIVLTRTDPDLPKHKGLTMFIIDLRSPGVTIKPIRQIDGGEHFNEVFLDNVRVPDANVLGGVNGGWHAATATLMNERVSLGAVRPLDDVPSTESLIEEARLSGALEDPVLQDTLTDLWMRQRVVGLLAGRITNAILSGSAPGPEGSVAKLVRTDFSNRSALLGAQIAGRRATAWSPGARAAGTWANNLLFVPSLSIAGGTDEVLKTIIGERVLGLPKEPQVDRDAPCRDLTKATS